MEQVLISTGSERVSWVRERRSEGESVWSGGDCGQIRGHLTSLKGKWDAAPGNSCCDETAR